MNTLSIGCLIDGGQHNATENDLAVIAIAKSLGYVPEEFDGELWQDDGGPTDEYADWLGFEAESAEQYLSEQELPPYTWIGWQDGDFGVWPIVDDELPKYDALPEFVYRVPDHGNVTLYRATYTEVWGIV